MSSCGIQRDPVFIHEVVLRDGFQNLGFFVPTLIKKKLIEKFFELQVSSFEFTSFVRADRIAQFVDAVDLWNFIEEKKSKSPLPPAYVYIPNERGFQTAYSLHIQHFGLSTATSETFLQKNINRTLDKNLSEMEHILAKPAQFRLYVSTVFGCPYEGEKIQWESLEKILRWAHSFPQLEMVLSDTIGWASPRKIKAVLDFAAQNNYPAKKISLHLHDTLGLALANIDTALTEGVRRFDSALGGLGGCPYALGASGNLCSEDLVYFLEQAGFDTGIDLDELCQTSRWLKSQLPSLFFPGKVHLVQNRPRLIF